MRKTIFMNSYPIYNVAFDWSEIKLKNIDDICQYFTDKINAHPVAAFIAIFNHYEHTKSLKDGEIAPEIKDAKNIVFCFGPKIPNPQMLAIRPRSIGVCDLGDKVNISFLETPFEAINQIMEQWVLELCN